MFDVGYGELLLIGIVALLVLGPDKLPGALRTAGLWISRFRRSFDRIRTEIEQEVGADDIRREIHNQLMLDQAKEIQREITETAQSTRAMLNNPFESLPTSRAEALAASGAATEQNGLSAPHETDAPHKTDAPPEADAADSLPHTTSHAEHNDVVSPSPQVAHAPAAGEPAESKVQP